MEKHWDKPDWRRLIAIRWAEEDPAGFFAHLEGLGRGRSGSHDIHKLEGILYRVWTRQDAEEAYRHALEHPWTTNFQYWGLDVVVIMTAEQDLDRALEMIKDAGDRLNGYAPGPWLQQPPETVLPKIAALPECSWRGMAINGVLEHWSERDPLEALAYYVERLDGDPLLYTGVNLAKAAVRHDAEAALKWSEGQPEPIRAMVSSANKVKDIEGEGGPAIIGPSERLPPE